jgi:hypothetical protein
MGATKTYGRPGEGRTVEPREGETLDVTARTYHTVDGVPHAEGETYTVAERWLAETLYGIGFVGIDGWTPPPEPLPDPETLRRRHERR